jgi:small subunit ribosomal protein S6
MERRPRVHEYELVYIIRPDLEEDGITAVNDKVGQWVTTGGGTVVKTEIWGRRKLAYPINRHTEGTYVLQRLQLPPLSVVELERNLKISEEVIRHLVVRTDESD